MHSARQQPRRPLSYRICEDQPHATGYGRHPRNIVSVAYYQPSDLFRGGVLDLDRSFGFLVNDVARLFGRRFDHNGRRLGLTRAQCRTLGYLARNEGINQAGLADLLEIRPMTLVRQIDRMEEAGWIERRPDPADRRARRLFLTAKARPILGRILNVANETRDEAVALLSPGEADSLIDLLLRVHATLSDRVPVEARPIAVTLPTLRASAAAAIAQPVAAKAPAVEGAR
jgi:MarR family transcriptional regulator for hemolysin